MTNTAENQEQPDSWKLQTIRDRMNELRALYQLLDDAKVSYKEAIEAVAQKANMNKAALATYVGAVMKDKEREHAEKAGQLSMLFEEL